jgi:mRNA interferase RelE/StbE
VQKTIRGKLDNLCEDPHGTGFDIKKLQGRDGYRLRVGNYRAIYRLDNNKLLVIVLEVGDRKEIY